VETLSWLFEKFVFGSSMFFGGVVCLVLWILFYSSIEKIRQKNRPLSILIYIVFMFFILVISKLIYSWGVEGEHIAIQVPSFHETQGEANSKAAGFGYGFYYSCWLFWGISFFLGVMSIVNSFKKKEPSGTVKKGSQKD